MSDQALYSTKTATVTDAIIYQGGSSIQKSDLIIPLPSSGQY